MDDQIRREIVSSAASEMAAWSIPAHIRQRVTERLRSVTLEDLISVVDIEDQPVLAFRFSVPDPPRQPQFDFIFRIDYECDGEEVITILDADFDESNPDDSKTPVM